LFEAEIADKIWKFIAMEYVVECEPNECIIIVVIFSSSEILQDEHDAYHHEFTVK
jgi:hypothetical protein